jgi:hypothetical protein
MPYPAKTSPREILDEAMAQVERGGANRLSDREALLAAVADEGARLLLAAVEDAARGREGADAVHSLAAAYLGFARTRPALYATVMAQHAFPAGSRPALEDLWDFATGLIGDVAGERAAAEATVAVWGLLHGAAGLDQAGLFGERKPGGGGVDFGLEALLKGMARS